MPGRNNFLPNRSNRRRRNSSRRSRSNRRKKGIITQRHRRRKKKRVHGETKRKLSFMSDEIIKLISFLSICVTKKNTFRSP